VTSTVATHRGILLGAMQTPHVDDDIRRAETLPASAFTEPSFLARELDTIFRSSWLCVPERGDDPRPLDEQVAARGSRVPITVLDRPLFVQRGWDDDTLRCFPNTCTHAWFPLVIGASRGPTLVCGQHGRRFDCQGKFVSQQGFTGDIPDFPRDCDHLTSLPISTWRRLTFVNMDKAASFDVSEIDASLAKMPAMPERMSAEIRDIHGNWKQHAWNFLDHFHIGFVHRAPHGLADAIDLASYKTELYDKSVLQWVYARDAADGFDPAWLPERFHDTSGKNRRVFALWWFVFPNLALNFYPWGLSVNVYQPIPGRPDSTRFVWYQFALDRDKHAERDRRWLSSQVDAEDVDALAQVSRGLRSGFAPRGRFAPEHEQAAHWFHRSVARAIAQ
jgi:choline monooxygenase